VESGADDDSGVPLRFRIAMALGACAIIAGVVAALSGRGPVAKFTCRNAPLADVAAPDGSRRAVSFVRDCGRRVPRSTQVSLLGPAEPLGNDRLGNVFVAELERPGAIEVRWAAPDELEIRLGEVKRAYRADPGTGATRVRYGLLR
jgi:hypothetical protein